MYTWTFTNKQRPKEAIRVQPYILDRQKVIVNCENMTRQRAVNHGDMARKISVSLIRLVCTDFSQLQLPVSGDKIVSFFLAKGGHLSGRSFISCFRKKEEVRVPFLHMLFFKCLLLKISICLSGIFRGNMLRTPIKPEVLPTYPQLHC